MPDLSRFPITRRWPAQHPERIQLYSLNTPNGVKASIMLEETGLAYEPHLVDIMQNESHTPEFLSLNPNGKIPAIIDPDGPGGRPLGLFESGAILIYLADKTGQFLPVDPARRYETIVFSWIEWPDKATRDAGMKKMMEDPRMDPEKNPMPFDGKRMIYGGFQPIVELGSKD